MREIRYKQRKNFPNRNKIGKGKELGKTVPKRNDQKRRWTTKRGPTPNQN